MNNCVFDGCEREVDKTTLMENTDNKVCIMSVCAYHYICLRTSDITVGTLLKRGWIFTEEGWKEKED